MTDRILTPSKITAWLDCAHFLTLKHREEAGGPKLARGRFGTMAQLLADKGLAHETECLASYRAEGRTVFEVPGSDRARSESFTAWIGRIGNPLADGHDVIYQMPFVHDGVRGIADFLIRVDHEDGRSTYEPVDAKLARESAKPGHVLQLCFYADAIEALTGARPEHAHIWLGSGETQSIRIEEVRPYWRRLRHQLVEVMEQELDDTSKPEPCAHCEFCDFADHCTNHWKETDSLIFVAGIRTPDRVTLTTAEIATLTALASLDHPIDELDEERSRRLVGQAALQLQARSMGEDAAPPFVRLDPPAESPAFYGFAGLPEPHPGDVFLDYEGHPFWRADRGLFFLFGLLTHDASGSLAFEARWAHDVADEGTQTSALIEYFAERRRAFPGMHVYHYNHTERSALERLARDHGVGERPLAELVDGGLFVDLLPVVRQGLQVGVESYGLKEIERLTSYERSHDIDAGAGAVVEYEAFMADGDPDRLTRIAIYNEHDVRATHALRDWLVAQRPEGLDWRLAFLEPEEPKHPELDEQIEALHAFGPETAEHLLGDVLGYWRREWRVTLANMLGTLQQKPLDLTADPEVLTGLHAGVVIERVGAKGKPITPALELTFPEQAATHKFNGDMASVVYAGGDGPPGMAGVEKFDPANRTVQLAWNEKSRTLGIVPTSVVLNTWVPQRPKPTALGQIATAVLSGSGTRTVGEALLRRELPAFATGHGPAGGVFTDDLPSILGWAPHLQRSYVAIQGPPGTGKTYTGAHLVLELVRRGKRVGITAMSHNAIDNLLSAVIREFVKAGEHELLRAVRRGPEPSGGGLAGVVYAGSNPTCAKHDFNLVAGTTWLFSGRDMQGAPVDVLLIDEAGQLCLPDALAASTSADSLILLGDPLQLPQVSQAAHPGGSGASVLEHVLGESVTISPERGVFLHETWRMHPDVCDFISEEIYEGRLTSHPSCATQTTDYGTGLRWLRATHSGRSTSSPEEAALVHDSIAEQIGTTWTDAAGLSRPLTVDDFVVVAPYNDQVDLLRAVLEADPRTHGVQVGTVDKFQGREAPVVYFTMTTSTGADMPRGPDFLFSKNRLNVAISRARCLAYLVCTDGLLNSRARDIDEMKLISTLCSFVERATPV